MKHHAECNRANRPGEDLLCNCGLLAVRDLTARAETAERERDEARARVADLELTLERISEMGAHEAETMAADVARAALAGSGRTDD